MVAAARNRWLWRTGTMGAACAALIAMCYLLALWTGVLSPLRDPSHLDADLVIEARVARVPSVHPCGHHSSEDVFSLIMYDDVRVLHGEYDYLQIGVVLRCISSDYESVVTYEGEDLSLEIGARHYLALHRMRVSDDGVTVYARANRYTHQDDLRAIRTGKPLGPSPLVDYSKLKDFYAPIFMTAY